MRYAAKAVSRPERGREEVRALLVDMLRDFCGIPAASISEAATIDRELEMESVEMVQLQVALEQELDITIDFLEVLRLNSLGRIVDYLHAESMHRGNAA